MPNDPFKPVATNDNPPKNPFKPIAANDNPPFAILWCYRTLYAEAFSRNRLFASLDFERWPWCPCCNQAMKLLLRDKLP